MKVMNQITSHAHRIGEDAIHQSALSVIVEVERLHLERQRLALLLAEVEDDDLQGKAQVSMSRASIGQTGLPLCFLEP